MVDDIVPFDEEEPARRPRKPYGRYDPAYVEQARKLCLLGAIDPELADFFDVSERTINYWRIQHPEFAAATKEGKDEANQRVVRSLFQRAVGGSLIEEQAVKIKHTEFDDKGKRKSEREEVQIVQIRKQLPPDVVAQIFWLKNRDKENWRDKHELEHSGEIGSTASLTDEELADIAAGRSARAIAPPKSEDDPS